MSDISKAFYLLAAVFLVLGLAYNFLGKFPRIPGDILIDKPGIRIYIPWVSSLVISIILALLFNFFRK